MRKISLFFIPILFLPLLTSCAQANNSPVKGKFVFYGIRDVKVGWAAYILKEGKLSVLGKKLTVPVFSPDGKTIAATHEKGIVLLDDEGNQQDLIELERRPGKLRWHPDGHKIFYSIETLDRFFLRMYDLKKKEDRLLLDMSQDAGFGAIRPSRDGRKVLLWVHYLRTPEKGGLFLFDLEQSSLKLLLRNGVGPNWHPDGKHIYFDTNKDESGKLINNKLGAIFKMNLETGETTKIQDLEKASFLSPIKLSHDGKYFYSSMPCGQDGQNIVAWPVGNPKKEITITACVSLGEGAGLSQDLDPDWYQGE